MATTSIIARLGLDTASFQRGIKKAEGTLTKFKRGLSGVGGFLGVGGFGMLAKQAIDAGSRIDDVSKKLGVSAEFLQMWGFAARETGVATESAEMAMQRFTRRLGEARQGAGELRNDIERYNISLNNADGTARDAVDVLRDYAEVIKSAKDPQERLRLAMKAFDSEGAGMVTVMAKGAQGLDEWMDKARAAGQVMGSDLVADLAEAENAIEQLQNRAIVMVGKLVTVFTKLGTAIGESLGKLTTADAEMLEIKDFMKQAQKNVSERMGPRPSTKRSLLDALSMDDTMSKRGTWQEDYEKAVKEEARKLLEEEEKRIRERAERLRKRDGIQLDVDNAETQNLKDRLATAKSQSSIIADLKKAITGLKSAMGVAVEKAKQEIMERDAAKLSLQEMASIGKFAPGVSLTAVNQGEQARDVLKMRQEAEQFRKVGEVGKAQALLSKAQAAADQLFRQGGLKSEEASASELQRMAEERSRVEREILKSKLDEQTKELREQTALLKRDRAYQ